MYIEFKCKSCGTFLRLPADTSVERVRCPKCKSQIDVPKKGDDQSAE